MSNVLNVLKANKTVILTGLACTGVWAVAFSSAKSAVKAQKHLQEAGELVADNKWELLAKKTKLVWKDYLITVILAMGTTACVIAAEKLNAKQIGSLATAVGLYKYKHEELEKVVRDKVGDEKFDEIRAAFNEQQAKVLGGQIIQNGDQEGDICYWAYTGVYFRSTPEKIEEGLKRFNELYSNRNSVLVGCEDLEQYASLNDLQYELGISGSMLGTEFGFTTAEELCPPEISLDCRWQEFHFDDGNKPVYVVNFDRYSTPEWGWDQY